MTTTIDCLHCEPIDGHICCGFYKIIDVESRDCGFCSHYIPTGGKTGEEIFKEVASRCMDPPRIVSDQSGQYYIPLGVRDETGSDK